MIGSLLARLERRGGESFVSGAGESEEALDDWYSGEDSRPRVRWGVIVADDLFCRALPDSEEEPRSPVGRGSISREGIDWGVMVGRGDRFLCRELPGRWGWYCIMLTGVI